MTARRRRPSSAVACRSRRRGSASARSRTSRRLCANRGRTPVTRRWDRGGERPSCSTASCVGWLNRAAFANPAPGTYGNMAFGTIRGPEFWEWDQSIYRDFRTLEGQTLQIRAEAFNVTNSVRFAPPNMVLTNGLFGNITSAYSTTGSATLTGSGGRIIQLALKYVF